MITLLFLAAVAAHPVATWKYATSIDKMTDDVTASAVLNGTDGSWLDVGCAHTGKGSVRVIVGSAKWLGDGDRPIFFRFDDKPAVAADGIYSGNVGSVFDDEKSVSFIKALMASKRLVVRLRGFGGSEADYSFSVAKAEVPVSKAYETCKDEKPF